MLQAEDSLFYRYGVEKGSEKEHQKLRARALYACRQRFSADEAGLAVLAERLQLVQDVDVLADFLLGLSAARDLEDILSLLPVPTSNGRRNGKD